MTNLINIIDHIINIDLANKININKQINIKQNDTNSHKFVINIFNNSLAYDLTGTTARIYFQKADGTKVFLDCVLDNALTGKLSCLLTTQALSYAGLVASEITIYGTAGEILTSVTFNFIVSEVIRDDMAIESTSEFTALTNALNAVNDAVLSIPTVEALNVDLQNNIVTGDALDITLKDDITTGDALDITLKDDITTGNITDTNIKDSTIIGDATDAALKADIIIAGQNEFATEITNARGGEINLDTRLDKVDTALVDNETKFSEVDNIIEPFTHNNAGSHNSIYRGKYLGSSVTPGQYIAISSGTFENLYIGDYWTIGVINWRIAAFNYFYNAGDNALTQNHITIVPDTRLYTHVMNDTNITTGAYVGSKLYTEGLNSAKATISGIFGSHLVTLRRFLSNATTDGSSSAGSWYGSDVELMNEMMVYGARVNGSAVSGLYDAGVEKSQLPLFALNPQLVNIRSTYWLRDVCSSTYFASVGSFGFADAFSASSSFGVRPAFSIS